MGSCRGYVVAMAYTSIKNLMTVIATNNTYSVKDLANEAFKNIGIKLKWLGKGLKERI